MNLRPRNREREDLGVNLTPLIDVVFLLLIFFMVSTTFRKEGDFDIDLPEADRPPVQADQEQLLVIIDREGHYSVNGEAVAANNVASLKQALQAAAGDNRRLPLILRADAQTTHQAVVRAMDAAGQLGFRRLSIATVESADE